MAANNISSKRAGKIVDYKQLNALSSVLLYDMGKKKNASFYEVEQSHNKAQSLPCELCFQFACNIFWTSL